MKKNGCNIDELLPGISQMSDSELDIIFYDSVSKDSMGFSVTQMKDAIKGIVPFLSKNDNIRNDICQNEAIVNYISDNKSGNKTALRDAISALLIIYLPQMAAFVAAEKIIRIGLTLYCENRIKEATS